MIVSDLDGTLTRDDQTISSRTMEVFHGLYNLQVIRVIATGRSLFSANKVLPPSFPIDYLLFSSGAGIMDWHSKQIIRTQQIPLASVNRITQLLVEHNLDFMIHKTIPDNHFFCYHPSGKDNPDFWRRIHLYKPYAVRYISGMPLWEACQLLAVFNKHALEKFQEIQHTLPDSQVVRTTSPLDHESIWMEIFPKTVSKAHAARWLCTLLKLNPNHTLAIGNDYNDLDLLRWSGYSVVTANAPLDLQQQFYQTDSNNNDGAANAIRHLLGL